MDAAQFTGAVRAMQGLPREIMEEACAMASYLSDEHRGELATSLGSASEQMAKNREEALAHAQQALDAMVSLRKEVTTKVRQGEEGKEREEEVSAAASNLNNL